MQQQTDTSRQPFYKMSILAPGTLLFFISFFIPFPVFAGETGAEPDTTRMVVLLHGLARSNHSMNQLETRLTEAGFQVHNIDYPSTRHTPEDLVNIIAAEIDACCKGASSLNFVTHSLGGILVRAYLARGKPSNLGRVVMLAPPNQGSEIVDTLGENEFYRWVLGPTAADLGTDKESFPNRLPPPDYEVGIIAGTFSINPVGSALIPDEDDGSVAVASTQLTGMTDFITLPYSHPFIIQSSEAAEQIIYFLLNGKFNHADGLY